MTYLVHVNKYAHAGSAVSRVAFRTDDFKEATESMVRLLMSGYRFAYVTDESGKVLAR